MADFAQLAPGQVFAADFRVVRPLSAGGMGSVYVVQQVSTGAERALKLMHPELVANPKHRARFEQEAKVGASIKSDHVVKVILAGIDAETGLPYLVMELLEGEELGRMLEHRQRLSPGEVGQIFGQLCHALGAAHTAGVVHRDLKPENIFIATSHRADVPFTVKVLDFGIAKVVAEAKSSATQSLGTPLYMAPEQGDARAPISPATDVWALAQIAFRLLTGKSFWLGAGDDGTVQQLMAEVLFYDIPSASARAAELGVGPLIPAGFDAWFAVAARRDASARFPNATEAWRAMAPVLGASSGSVPAGSFGSSPSGRQPFASAPISANVGAYAQQPPMITPAPPFGAPAPAATNVAQSAAYGQSGGFGPGQTALGARAQAPGGYGQAPTGYAQAPTGYAQAPSGYAQAPTGYAQAPSGYAQAPTGYAQAPSGSGAPPIAPNAPPPLAQKRDRKRTAIIATAIAVPGAALTALGIVLATRGSASAKGDLAYCAEFVEANAIPSCVDSLTPAQRKGRRASYRLTTKDGKVIALDYVDAHDHPLENERGWSSLALTYDKTRLKEVAYKNRSGDVQYKLAYNAKATEAKVLSKFGDPMRLGTTRVTSFNFERDAKGFVTVERTFNARGKPTFNRYDTYGLKYVRDDKGREKSFGGLDASDKPMRTNRGYASLSRTFDGARIKSERYLDSDGKPVLSSAGFAGEDFTYDDADNVKERRRMGLDGSPTTDDDGAAVVRNIYNDDGELIRENFLDLVGDPIKFGSASTRYAHNDAGDVTEVAYLDASANPWGTTSTPATTKYKYDAKHRITEVARFGPDGKPALYAGFASQTLAYDDRGNVVEERFVDGGGKLMRNNSWYAIEKTTYDDHDHATAVAYFDADGNATLSNELYARKTQTYDASGNMIEVAYFDTANAPTMSDDGYARLKRTFDDLENITSEAYFDANGKPSMKQYASASFTRTFDENGLRLTSAFYDALGKPLAGAGRASEKYTRDVYGNYETVARYNEDGKPAAPAVVKYTYDAHDRRIVEQNFDADGKPTTTGGYARETYRYDDWGRTLEVRYFGVDGQPALHETEKIAGRIDKFNARGQKTESLTIDVNGQPLVTDAKYARTRWVFNPNGTLQEVAYFGANNEPVDSVLDYHDEKSEYDYLGREISSKELDASGKVVREYAMTFDDLGHLSKRVSKWRGLGDDSNSNSNVTVTTYKRDDRDLIYEERDEDENGAPHGRAPLTKRKFDARGKVIEVATFDGSGSPVTSWDDCAVHKYKYDAYGHEIEDACFGVDGAPVNRYRTGAITRRIYDENANLVRTEHVDTSGNVTTDSK